MDLKLEDVESILTGLRPWLTKNRNIVGMKVGKKVIAGRETEQWSVVTYVVKKKTKSELSNTDFLIPEEVELHLTKPEGNIKISIPTDVVESGPFKLESNNSKQRPCPGGYQIQGFRNIYTGTLGVNIEWQGVYSLLSCNHVLSVNGQNQNGVYQPTMLIPNILVKGAPQFVNLTLYTDPNYDFPTFNTQDLAWIPIDEQQGSPDIIGLCTPAGIRAPIVGEKVSVVGAQTGTIKKAKITSLKFQVGPINFNDSNQYAWFDNLIELNGKITQTGDSGAAYIAEKDNMLVGIHMGSTSLNSYGCQLA
jgi:hypothetical protein